LREEAEKKRGYRVIHQLLQQDLPDVMVRQPVFVTPEEREESTKLEKLTISAIAKRIEQLICQFQDGDTRDEYRRHFVKNVKRKKKEYYVRFHQELSSAIENQSDGCGESEAGREEVSLIKSFCFYIDFFYFSSCTNHHPLLSEKPIIQWLILSIL
jgi:hypothetical protein